MKICYYANRMQFDGDTLEKCGIGGSESALINITSAWKQLFPNDEVVVYNGYTKKDKSNYNGVIYKSIDDLYLDVNNLNADAFISLRESWPFKFPYIDAKLKLFHSEDDMNEVDLQNLQHKKYERNSIDAFLAISNYAKNEIQKGFPEKEVLLLRNGYNSNWINNTPKNVNPKYPVAIYASTPFRGLDVLASCWPLIFDECRKHDVFPSLKVCSGMSLYNQSDKDFVNLYDYLKTQPKVEFVGAIPQKELYALYNEAKVMLYPNHFLETGCMACTEAIANDCWVVTTNLGALNEQVVNDVTGFIIDGDSRSLEYQKVFIEKSVESLVNNNLIPKKSGLVFSWEDQVQLLKKYISERI